MNAYFVTCTGYEADDDGTIRVVHCTYDPETKGGNAPDGRKVKGTIHWVEASNAGKVEVRLYENIVDEEKGVYNKEDGSLNVNPNSLTVTSAYVEPGASESKKVMTASSLCATVSSAQISMTPGREHRYLTASNQNVVGGTNNVAKKDACMACKECEVACSEAFFTRNTARNFPVFTLVWQKMGRLETGSMCTVRQMCEGLSGGCHHPECQGRLHDQQKEMRKLRQMCRSLSVRRDRMA